ncbi:abscission/NoCut checkpoint regulator-like isoform X3 [Argiope bruennichi]|uniref:abscission/NoCut checkpoint regulator-like isoform X3 n=1 Tax=Argiope bruennichi TaxID=94029 RepID=UPI0024948114|nr:abscission/NoCut checkpoint regulator-like isoform X3 [Argiope bruennichi]
MILKANRNTSQNVNKKENHIPFKKYIELDMSCYSCSSEFGFLKKEVGCEVCGFSFCSKCCKRQQVPSEDGESKKIMCNKCFKELTCDESKPTSKPSPPLAHKRRMQALKKQSFSVDSSAHIRLKSQMSNETDKDLAERLQKLKRDRVKAASPSESEIEERLAKLKGMDPGKYKAPPIQRKTEEFNIPPSLAPGETEEMPISDEYSMLHEESRNLSDQACKEVKKLNTDMEYKNLLSTMQKKKETESEDDEEEADKLVEKLLATQLDDVDMEEMDSLNDLDADKSSSKAGNKESVDEEELPWCVICTEDAKIRCFGCEGDLYCSRCFKECHDSLDIKDHKTCPYLPPKVPMM